jgi:hypothetical protein
VFKMSVIRICSGTSEKTTTRSLCVHIVEAAQ